MKMLQYSKIVIDYIWAENMQNKKQTYNLGLFFLILRTSINTKKRHA